MSHDSSSTHQNHKSRFAVLLGIFLLTTVLSVCLGSETIPLSSLWDYLSGDEVERRVHAYILEYIRLPKTVTAICAGSALAVAGLVMQTLFRNPLADPFVLGINAGASLGVGIVVLIAGPSAMEWLEGLGMESGLGMVGAAATGAAAVLLLVLYLSRRVDMMTLLIVGLIVGYATSALVSVMMYLSVPERLQTYVAWSFGSFSNVDWMDARILGGACACGIMIAWLCVKPLNAFMLGETYARSLGVNVRQMRGMLILSAALLAGAITAYCGPIGFIGVAVPHLCRGWLHTSDHRLLMPACLLAGASTALAADLIARLPGTEETLPLNAITALIGAPVILTVLLRKQSLRVHFTR